VKGAVIILFWEGSSVPDPEDGSPRVINDYLVTVWNKPTLHKGGVPADEQVKAIFLSLHGWKLGDFCQSRMNVQNIRLITHPKFLVYQLRIKAPAVLR